MIHLFVYIMCLFLAVLVEIDRIRQRRKHEGGDKHRDDDSDYNKKMKEATRSLMPLSVST